MEFKSWGKTTRLDSECVITEKIDGTNAAVVIQTVGENITQENSDYGKLVFGSDGTDYLVGAQSRKKLITPDSDNAGFASWVWKNATELVDELGPGYHYGEWWGNKIQRGYGRKNGEKFFSLFDPYRYGTEDRELPGLQVAPIIAHGTFTGRLVELASEVITRYGSWLVTDDFYEAEGLIVLFKNNKARFKIKWDEDSGDPNSIYLAPVAPKRGVRL